jgi:hypothetical protein
MRAASAASICARSSVSTARRSACRRTEGTSGHMKPSWSSRPDFGEAVEIGRQRQARDSLVSVRCTPRSSSGCSRISSTVSGNQGHGTMTEAVVTKPCPASSTNARLAPWHTPTSSMCGISTRASGA